MRFTVILLLTWCFAVPAWCQDDAPTASKAVGHVGSMVEDFSLLDYRGTEHTLSKALADSDLVVLAFLGAECPLARLYGPRLEQLAEHFAGQRVSFLGVNSNRHDSLEEIELYVRRSGISFPLLKDSANKLADALAADRTPEVVVLDAERRIRYRGRIDDQYGVGFSRPAPTREDLKRALEELAAGEPVTIPQTTAVGCHIGRLLEPDIPSASATLRGVPSKGRNRALPTDQLRGGCRLGGDDSRGDQRSADATLACRSSPWQLYQCPADDE